MLLIYPGTTSAGADVVRKLARGGTVRRLGNRGHRAESPLRVQVLSSVEGREPSFQIGLEILDILQPDVEPQCRTTRGPLGGRAVGRAVKWNDEAFEAAP